MTFGIRKHPQTTMDTDDDHVNSVQAVSLLRDEVKTTSLGQWKSVLLLTTMSPNRPQNYNLNLVASKLCCSRSADVEESPRAMLILIYSIVGAVFSF